MASLFSKNPSLRPPLPPYSFERIEKEIDHLRKKGSVRNRKGESMMMARLVSSIAIGALLWLYFMDPFLYAYHKGDAIRAYLYLSHYGGAQKAQALVASEIISPSEQRTLDRRNGAYQDYFTGPAQAAQTADSIVSYMKGLSKLRTGQYDALDPIGKLRYILFVRMGLLPPVNWSSLDPAVEP